MTISKNVIMVLDTETCDLSGSVYDVGYTITNKKGDILATRNFLVREIFTDASRMMGAFYAKKMFSHYAPMLDDGLVKLTAWADIVEQIRADVRDYGINIISAYNAGFDLRVMRNTNALLGDGSAILPKGLKVLDIWQFACETKLSQKAYKKLLALAVGYRQQVTLKLARNFAIATLAEITILLRIIPRYQMQ